MMTRGWTPAIAVAALVVALTGMAGCSRRAPGGTGAVAVAQEAREPALEPAPAIAARLKMPADLETPSVLVGADFATKSVFVTEESLGAVTDIVQGELDAEPGPEIGIAASRGAVFVDLDGKTRSSVAFSRMAYHVDIVDVEGDGVCEFMNRGHWVVNASLINHDGKEVWHYGGDPGVDDMCAGDVDGDGTAEFVVGFNGGGGVHLLTSRGQKEWEQPDGNVWHVELVDTNADGDFEIVHSNARGKMTVRDAAGAVLRRASPPGYFAKFSLCKWPTKQDREYVLTSDVKTIRLLDFDATSAAQFDAPKCPEMGQARGVPVVVPRGKGAHLAVLVEFRPWERSVLYVYDADGTLVYQEILPEACGSIAALPLGGSEADTLLVGGQGQVWRYELHARAG